jgi:hypothetical protein
MLDTDTSIQTNVRQSLTQEIEQTSDYLLGEVLDFLLFIRAKHVQIATKDDPKEKVLEDLRQSFQDMKAGSVDDISQLWDGIDV